MCLFETIKCELHLCLKLIWIENLNGVCVPTLSMRLNAEWPFPSPQAGCTFRTCPHTANTAPLYWANSPSNSPGPFTFLQAAPHPKPQNSGFLQSCFPSLWTFGSLLQPLTNDVPSPPGALYSRKFTIDGEQISLQVQDTPFVSLEVKQLLCAFQHASCLMFVASTSICN